MRRPGKVLVPVVLAAALAAGCSSSTDKAEDTTSQSPESCSYDKTVAGVTAVQQGGSAPQLIIAKGAVPPKKLVVTDLCPGEGVAVQSGDTVVVDYVGAGYANQQVFDSSFQTGQPLAVQLTPASGLLEGWLQGVPGMKPRGARLLLIPGSLAYGPNPPPGSPFKPDEALAFIVEMDQIVSPNGSGSPPSP